MCDNIITSIYYTSFDDINEILRFSCNNNYNNYIDIYKISFKQEDKKFELYKYINYNKNIGVMKNQIFSKKIEDFISKFNTVFDSKKIELQCCYCSLILSDLSALSRHINHYCKTIPEDIKAKLIQKQKNRKKKSSRQKKYY